MAQYNRIKSKYPDAILLFRVGDFYETFGADAIKTADILGIVLTKRANGSASHIELAGFPHHALNTYLPKLVRAGYRVAICDQLEDPKQTKVIVKRGVTELVTPGVTHNDQILDNKKNNFLASFFMGKKSGLALVDISTGEFLVSEGSIQQIDKLLQSFAPAEVIFQKNQQKDFVREFGKTFYTYGLDEWIFSFDNAYEKLTDHFGTSSLKGFGVENLNEGIIAAGAALHYLADTEHPNIQHLTHLSRIQEDEYVWLDRFTVRNLELLDCLHEEGVSLVNVLDKTISPMGSRMLRRWIALPLKERSKIEQRHEIVELLVKENELREQLQLSFKTIGDLERIISKVSLGKVNPRELVQLKRALKEVRNTKQLLQNSKHKPLIEISKKLEPCNEIIDLIEESLIEEAPNTTVKGGMFNDGVSSELDELREIAHSGKDYLLHMQEREMKATGISSLKIGFNNVFGYYLEVTNRYKDIVPSGWTRKQTLTNAERFITEELKEYEEKIIGAEGKMLELENKLFNELIASISRSILPVQ